MPSLDSFGRRLSQGFDQVKQFATEKFGIATEVTEFPPAYRQLDEKMDKVKEVFDTLARTVTQMSQSENYNAPLGDSIKSSFDRIQESIRNSEFAEGRIDTSFLPGSQEQKTISKALSETCLVGADLIGEDLNVSSDKSSSELMRKFGKVQSNIADARSAHDGALRTDFLMPFSTYEGAYESANQRRKNATRVRLLLDACKAKTQDGTDEELKKELEALELEFVAACDDAIHEMRNFLQHANTIHCLESLTSIQLAYHKKCAENLLSLKSNF